MKVGQVPLASIVLVIYALISFVCKHFFPADYNLLAPYIDGGIVGAMLVFGLYYFNIFFTAWKNNRSETLSSK